MTERVTEDDRVPRWACTRCSGTGWFFGWIGERLREVRCPDCKEDGDD